MLRVFCKKCGLLFCWYFCRYCGKNIIYFYCFNIVVNKKKKNINFYVFFVKWGIKILVKGYEIEIYGFCKIVYCLNKFYFCGVMVWIEILVMVIMLNFDGIVE